MAPNQESLSGHAPAGLRVAEKQIVEQQKKIDFYLTDYSVELLANKMRNGDFEIPTL